MKSDTPYTEGSQVTGKEPRRFAAQARGFENGSIRRSVLSFRIQW